MCKIPLYQRGGRQSLTGCQTRKHVILNEVKNLFRGINEPPRAKAHPSKGGELERQCSGKIPLSQRGGRRSLTGCQTQNHVILNKVKNLFRAKILRYTQNDSMYLFVKFGNYIPLYYRGVADVV